MSNATVFNKGIPTEPDVRRLCDVFADLPAGRKLAWSELAAVIGSEYGTHRFRSVVAAWRKKMDRERNILFGAVRGYGIEVLDGHGRTGAAGSTYKAGIRRVSRAGDIAVRTDVSTLSPQDRRVVDHVTRVAAELRLVAATRTRQLLPLSEYAKKQ